MERFFGLILAVSLLICVYLLEEIPRRAKRKRSLPFRAFAQETGLSYRYHGRSPSLRAVLFGRRYGGGNDVSNVMDGVYRDHRVKMFTYLDKYTVVQSIMQVVAPHILVKATCVDINTMPMWRINPNKLVLAKSYEAIGLEVYVTSGYEIEALQIFTPEVIDRLSGDRGIFCVDIYNGKVFVYDNIVMQDSNQMKHLLDTAVMFLDKKKGSVEALDDDFASLVRYFGK